jgi:hypothetical protein
MLVVDVHNMGDYIGGVNQSRSQFNMPIKYRPGESEAEFLARKHKISVETAEKVIVLKGKIDRLQWKAGKLITSDRYGAKK